MAASEVLKEAADLIETKGWCQQAYARSKTGREVNVLGKAACSFCLVGAIYVAQKSDLLGGDIYRALRLATGILYPTAWNDAPGRTKQEVIDALRKAAEVSK